MKALSILLAVILLTGCVPSSEQLTVTAVEAEIQTQTAAPTLTPTFTPTFTASPTLTPTDLPTATPEPIPATIGDTVKYNGLEITLLEVATHSHIVTGGYYSYYSKPGQIFIDMAVLVRNPSSIAFYAAIGDLYIVEETDDAWYSNFYGFKTVDVGRSFNPLATIQFEKTGYKGEEIAITNDTYLRLVYYVQQNQDILFGIQDSPQFTFNVK
jgi:hypothetical protein